MFPRNWSLLEQRSPQKSSIPKSSVLRIFITGLVWNQEHFLNLLLPVNYMCLATSNLKFKTAFLTALWYMILMAWVPSSTLFDLSCSSTVKNRTFESNTDCPERVNFQEVGGWCIMCFNSKNGPMTPSQGKNATISLSLNIDYIIN
jgi:hypothetical protein